MAAKMIIKYTDTIIIHVLQQLINSIVIILLLLFFTQGYNGPSTADWGYSMSAAFHMDNVGCSGSEVRIQDCAHNGWGNHNCNGLNRGAGVRCTVTAGIWVT